VKLNVKNAALEKHVEKNNSQNVNSFLCIANPQEDQFLRIFYIIFLMDFCPRRNDSGNQMNVSQALIERKSVRAFLNKPVPNGLVIQILDHAKCTPSGTNTQPWQVAVVSGKTKKDLDKKLEDAFWNGASRSMDYDYYPKEFTTEFKRRRIECGLLMYQTLGINREDKDARLKQWALNYSAFGAPVVLYCFADKCIEKGSYLDCGMFIQSIMLMATSLGLATCPEAALAEYASIVKNTLGYPLDSILLCGIALGYEDEKALINSYRTPREPVESFTNFFE
jgi:nitroreductase